MATKAKNNNGKSKRKRTRNALITGFFMIAIPLLAFYLLVSNYYKDHFYNNTVINGVETSNMTSDVAEDAINDQVKNYSLVISGRGGLTDTITGEEINLHTTYDESLSDLIDKQNTLAWPSSVLKHNDIEVKTMLELDESLLDKVISELIFLKEENNIKPADASISKYGENGYEIIPENPGAEILADKLKDEVLNAIIMLEPALDLEEAKLYTEPELTSDNAQLKSAVDELNRIAGAKITYEFGDDTEIVDGTKISEWLTVDGDYKVSLNTEGVKEFVDYIGKNYNSFGRTREFKTSYGDVLQIKGGDYGWWLNRPAEVEELTKLIQDGEKQTKTPVYFQTAQQYGKDDIGNTYVEVNLTAQHLFFYHEGKLILETDFVSGNESKKWGTPVGTYPVQYKENDATLVGEDYETPVKYWMPFNKNIGFHDANWRSDFGKDIYLKNGSHGCINMPPKMAKKMFEYIKRGVAVVVYELPGTENYEVKDDTKTNTGTKTDIGSKTGTNTNAGTSENSVESEVQAN
ncbi:MAG: ErfK/YbiS/YcfS/YnhG family protein [Herbinix sp.]|nr:ErfK/YbiS/YcfS/YnhG family protein [Herbinix sp.]